MHLFTSIPLFVMVAAAAPLLEKKAKKIERADINLIRDLITAPTMVDRINLLPKNSDFVFKFTDPPFTSGISKGHG